MSRLLRLALVAGAAALAARDPRVRQVAAGLVEDVRAALGDGRRWAGETRLELSEELAAARGEAPR